MTKTRYLIIGAAGRDFHNFNTIFRDNDEFEVVGFTAAQIPNIDSRMYPASLSGKLYPDGLKIWKEEELPELIQKHKVQRCMLAYSDLPYSQVMQLAAKCLAAGSDFELAQPFKSMVKSEKPVIAVTAVRTGCGKSQTSKYVIDVLLSVGLKAVLVRHPMPYGDLAKQAVQRFETYDDLEKHDVTIEEREEYEQHLKNNVVVYAGVDYEAILRQAEKEADVVLWDGGNNDEPFYKPDIWIVVTDPLRAGHESMYYPGDVNFRAADIIVINKANTASQENIDKIVNNAKHLNPDADLVIVNSEVKVDKPELIKGKRVVCVDDGPTLTHGEMEFGAGKVAAEKYEASEVVDPRPCFKGSLQDTHKKYPKIGKLIPAMGYFPQQIRDLEQTINAVDCDSVVLATPMDLRKLVKIDKPATAVTYGVEDREEPFLKDALLKRIKSWKGTTAQKKAVANTDKTDA